MTDPTETTRRQMLAAINAQPSSREYLEHKHGQVWDTQQLSDDFEVIGLHGSPRRREKEVRQPEGHLDVPSKSQVLLQFRGA